MTLQTLDVLQNRSAHVLHERLDEAARDRLADGARAQRRHDIRGLRVAFNSALLAWIRRGIQLHRPRGARGAAKRSPNLAG